MEHFLPSVLEQLPLSLCMCVYQTALKVKILTKFKHTLPTYFLTQYLELGTKNTLLLLQ